MPFYWICVILIITSFFGNIISNQNCDIHKLSDNKCNVNQTCDELTGKCECKVNYQLEEKTQRCILPLNFDQSTNVIPNHDTNVSSHDDSVSGSSVAAGILIPLTLIALAVGLIYAARRYNWLHRVRRLRHSRYDEVRIGREDDDDPPID